MRVPDLYTHFSLFQNDIPRSAPGKRRPLVVHKKAFTRPSYLSFSFDALHVLSTFPAIANRAVRIRQRSTFVECYRDTMVEQSMGASGR